MKILILDQGRDYAPIATPRTANPSSPGVRVADKCDSGNYNQIIVVDSGDAASRRHLDAALRYRGANRGCELALLRRLDPHWSDAECRARMMTSWGDTLRNVSPDVMQYIANSADAGGTMRVNRDSILFEYAA